MLTISAVRAGSGGRKADASNQVSAGYLQAARKEGLANPLSGLNDPRLKNPDNLTKDNWVKDDFSPDLSIYRYEVGGQTVQYYGKSADGHEAIGTFDRTGNSPTVEHVEKTPDGKVSRSSGPADDGDDGTPGWVSDAASKLIRG